MVLGGNRRSAIILNVIFVSFIPFVGWLIGLAATVLTLSAAVRRAARLRAARDVDGAFLRRYHSYYPPRSHRPVFGGLGAGVPCGLSGGFIQLIVGLVVVFFLVQSGDAGPNRYGPPRA